MEASASPSGGLLMAKLSIEQAPAPCTPRLFLLSASAWGCVAGVILLAEGGAALSSRWTGGTLALVHAFTLGLLGNAMFGGLLQFLPVVAGVRTYGGRIGARLLHGLLNLGASGLVASFLWPRTLEAWWGGLLLAAAFALLAAVLLPGVCGAVGQRFLRWGTGGAIVAGVVTACLGLLLALGVSGMRGVPLVPLTDVHAAWGLLGWVMALLAAVARVVGPMFQGMALPPVRWHGAWQVVTGALLVSGLVSAFHDVLPPWFNAGAGLVALSFAMAGLLSQVRAPKLRRVPLTAFWAAGLLATAVAAAALLVGASAMLVGVLAIGIGFPLLVVGMQLEIVAFLGWIGLHRRCGRGVRLPGVQLLMPERDKYVVLALHLIAAAALLVAVALPPGAMPRIAGVALLLAHAMTLAALCGVGWRSHHFIRNLGRQP